MRLFSGENCELWSQALFKLQEIGMHEVQPSPVLFKDIDEF